MNLRKNGIFRSLALTVFLFELIIPSISSGASTSIESYMGSHFDTPHHPCLHSPLTTEESNENEEERDKKESLASDQYYEILESSLINFIHRIEAASFISAIHQSVTFQRLFLIQRKLLI